MGAGVLLLGSVPGVRLAAEPIGRVDRTPAWVFVDGPLWDISDEGLPYRITVAWVAKPDRLTRLLRAGETRWTVGTGYAVVYDNLDTGTNTISSRGRDGLIFNAAKQALWPIPLPVVGDQLHLEFEIGLNYAARSLPSDGTHLSFSVIPGFEWSKHPGPGSAWAVGVRWLHLSHGGLFGHNGGYDGLVVRLGRRWTW